MSTQKYIYRKHPSRCSVVFYLGLHPREGSSFPVALEISLKTVGIVLST